MLNKCGVYLILCRPTGEFFIGGTLLPFRERFVLHLSLLRQRTCLVRLLQAAWDRHGEDAFEFQPLEACLPGEVSDRRREAVERLRPALNWVPKTSAEVRASRRDHNRKCYRRKRGLDVDAPPHMAKKLYDVGLEHLTLVEIAARAGLAVTTIRKRIKRGVAGEALLEPKY